MSYYFQDFLIELVLKFSWDYNLCEGQQGSQSSWSRFSGGRVGLLKLRVWLQRRDSRDAMDQKHHVVHVGSAEEIHKRNKCTGNVCYLPPKS